MSFPKFYKWGKRVRGFLGIFVASIYHPFDNKEHGEFNEKLSSLVSSLPKIVHFIGVYDVNVNLGIHKLMHKRVIGVYGLKNCNKKGRNLLGIFGKSGEQLLQEAKLHHMEVLQ